jgi:hypothetical protein
MPRRRRIRKPGIYDLTAAEYLADPCAQPSLNRSIARWLVDASPAHAWQAHPRYGNRADDNADDDTMDVGSAAHAAFLLGEDLIAEFPFDSWRSDAAKARRAAARLTGRIPLLRDKAATVRAVVEALYRFRQRTGAFTQGKAEQTVIWREGDSFCRCKPDWLPDDPTAPLWDLKVTSGIASPASWKYRGAEVAADIQAVMYPRGVGEVRHRTPDGMRFCVVEEQEPHGIRVFRYTGEAEEIAQAKWDRALELWQQCQASGEWPGYSDDEVFLDASYAARTDWGEFTATVRGLANTVQKREDVTEKVLRTGFA